MTWIAVVLSLPALAWAGVHDYYECRAADSSVVFSIQPCGRGQAVRRIESADAPVSVRLPSGGGVLRLEKERWGGFSVDARINGVPLRAAIDTGASVVALGPAAAARVGLDSRRGQRAVFSTANGQVGGSRLLLDAVEVGGNRVKGVPGVVLDREMGLGHDVLIGMSFLRHFELSIDGLFLTMRPR